MQIAKSSGAQVTGVCSTRNVELIRSLGADEAIDYTREDFAQSGKRYDVIFDSVGKPSLSKCRQALSPDGTLLLVGAADGRWVGPLARPIYGLVLSRFVGQKLIPYLAKRSKDDLVALAQLVEAGTVTPVIDRSYPLSEVREAIRYLEAGHAQGKVVITVC